MLGSKCISIFATLLALSAYGADAGALPSGICYSPWHHTSVTSDVVQKDLAQVKQYFSSFRSFHASFSGVNVIDAAASAGLKVAVGIMMGDASGIAGEIKAACEGANRNPGSVAAIYVGNENLKNGNFGTYSVSDLVGYINQVKQCTTGLNIKVGTVQRINEWLNAADVATLAAASDSIGVNIYPFFTAGDQTPIEKLQLQWNQMTAMYAESKLALTETGWPRQGETTSGNVPSKETQQQFLNDFGTWSTTHTNSYFFMMFDTKVSYSGMEYEKYFGIADMNGALQVTVPGGSGSSSESTTQAPAATPAATPATPATPAATPATPAATPATPAATPATPAATTPTVTPAPAPAPAPAVTQATPATTAPAAGATTTPAAVTPAVVVPGPAPTPASTGSGKKIKKTHCD